MIMPLTKEQYNLIKRQLQAHNRQSGIKTITLDKDNNVSLELLIEKGVFGSDIITTATHLAQFLYQHPELYSGKDAADIGCGPGTQGMIMAKYGAKSVLLSDINPKAVSNTQKNIEKYNLSNTKTIESDLFNNFPQNKTFDVIVFNHPFFSGDPKQFKGDPNDDVMLRSTMLGETELIKRFFQQVPKYLKEDGIIIMPYFHFAGPENNPANHIENYKLKVLKEHKIISKKGFHMGDVSIYIISK